MGYQIKYLGNASLSEKYPSYGQTVLNLKRLGHDTEQATSATVGAGNIFIGGVMQDDGSPLFAGLNRDITRSQRITKDKVTGALDATLVIDNRWFMPSKRNEVDPKTMYEENQAKVDNDEVFKEFLPSPKDKELSIFDVNNDKYKFMGTDSDDHTSDWNYILSGSDKNPILGFLYNYFPGAKSATLVHDVEMRSLDNPSKLGLAISIPGSFINSYYSNIFGKPFANTNGGVE